MSKEAFEHYNKFCRFVEWYYGDETREYCSVYHPSDEDFERDGQNVVGAGGNEGFKFDIFGSLEEAIENSTYKVDCWNKIDFSNLSNVEQQRALDYIKEKQNKA